MKAVALAALAVLAACSTPERRIKKNRSAFDAYPPGVQEQIRRGKIDVGFTAEQVAMALGKPDRVYTRKSASGSQEVWAYGDDGWSRGVGFGLGVFGGGGTVYDAGVAVGTGEGGRYEDRGRVVFEGGRVVSVETRDK